MKKIFMMVTAFGMMAVTAQGQACDTLRGNLTSMTLTPSTNYVLEGVVVVPDGEILTIRPGVTICALPDAGLVIDKGGTIEAIGKADSLITFTSLKAPHLRAPGDWRGIAWLGDDRTNESFTPTVLRGTSFSYGNTVNPMYNGGTMRYVSITHAGQVVAGDNKPASLFLGALGSATTIDHVQILESAEDALRLFGGTIEIEDIYIQNAEKSDIYASTGYVGKMTNLLAIKNPAMKTTGYFNNTKGIYVENDGSGSSNTPLTNPTIDAFTLIGPQQCDELTGDVSTGIYFDKNGGGTFKNGVVSGYFNGIEISDDNSSARTNTDLIFEYTTIGNNINDFAVFTGSTWNGCDFDMKEWLTNSICTPTQFTQENNIVLGYNASICEDFCEDAPLFQLSLSELQEREFSSLKVGVLQEDPVFTWVQTCPAATCCEASPQARILPLEAYPNPVQHTVTMLVPEVQDQHVKVQVIEMTTGRILYQQVQAKKAQLTVDMSKLPQGNYKVQIVTELAIYQATINKD